MNRITEDGLKALVQNEMRQALGFAGGKLAEQRRKSEIYYLGEAELDLSPPEIPDRSTFVSTDVRNVIEAMLPQLMVKFVGGDTVIEFEPTKPEDEDKAQSCTDYLNYLFFKKNNGHNITYMWFKDALLQKRGIVKTWWDTRKEETREEYKGMTDVELAQILDDPEVEPIDQKSYPDEEDAKQRAEAIEQLTSQRAQIEASFWQAWQAGKIPPQQAEQAKAQVGQQLMGLSEQIAQIEATPVKMLYDVSFKRVKSGGKITVENVPPEEFFISRDAKPGSRPRLIGHRFRRSLSALKSMGYKNLDNIGSDEGNDWNAEYVTRMNFDDAMAGMSDDVSGDDSAREVWVSESYMQVDYDGDGIAELRKITLAGNELLDNEVVDDDPFSTVCPVPMPHKFFGLSVADLTMESQRTNTKLVRAQLDNTYLQVNGRYFAEEGQVNLDDLLTSRPGGVVRIKRQGAVGRLDQAAGDMGAANNMLEWFDRFKEDSTGWTKYSQGNDSKGLTETAEGMNIITNKADMRVDLIARHFAEGFRDLFNKMLKLVCQNQNQRAQIRLSGRWVDIDPREWRNQFDVNINVGIGMGNRDQRARHMGMLMAHQANVMAIGVSTPENVYQSSIQFAQDLGFRNANKFFNDPKENPPPPKPDPNAAAMQIEQAKGQIAMQKSQMEQQFKAQASQAELQHKGALESAKLQHEGQLEALRMQMQQATDNNRQEAEAQQHAMKIQYEAQLEQLKAQYDDAKHQREMEFQRWKAELDASVKIETANIASKAKIDNAATTTATNEIAAEVRQ